MPRKPAPQHFGGVLVIEGEPTGDGRYIVPGALSWRDLPLPLMMQKETPQGGLGGNPHGGAKLAGRIDHLWRDENVIRYAGVWDSGEDGQEGARLAGDQTLKGISADLDNVDFEIDEEAGQATLTSGRVMGGTACAFPALPGAGIGNVTPEVFEYAAALATQQAEMVAQFAAQPEPHAWNDDDGNGECDVCGLDRAGHDAQQKKVRAAAGVTGGRIMALTAAAERRLGTESNFENPKLTKPTALVITDDRRVYGHAAIWGTPHSALAGRTPPHSATKYAHFLTGARRVGCDCDDGYAEAEIPVGSITLGTGHAAASLNPRETLAHYDNTGSVVADVAVGEDDIGIWIAGELRPGIGDDEVIALRGASLSGDWRRMGGNLELVALLAVNVPGFAVPRQAFHIEDDRETALVASGVVEPVTQTIEATVSVLSPRATSWIEAQARQAAIDDASARLGLDDGRGPFEAPIHFSIEMIEDAYIGKFRDFNTAARKKAAKSGAAMPDGSYPIENCDDWDNARQAIGRANAADRSKVQAHIDKRGKALGCEDKPNEPNESTEKD